MKKILGVDIGGTNTKFGLVTSKGELLKKKKYPTADLIEKGSFIIGFMEALHIQLDKHQVTQVGIGIPGLISKDRRSTIKASNIPGLDGLNIIDQLEKEFPKIKFKLENDANCAILGEFHFSKEELPKSFAMITLGTGIGGAAVIDGKLFPGGNGNGVEIGHMISTPGLIYEDFLGKNAIVAALEKKLKGKKNSKGKFDTSALATLEHLTSKDITKAAVKGDELAIKVFKKFGKTLGDCIVSTIRILDVDTIVLGGGVAQTFDIIEKPVYKKINKHLTGEYYKGKVKIKLATLENEAGILGAASLMLK